MSFYITRLPTLGHLYETSSNFRIDGTDPKNAPDPIGEHLLPFLVTDPLHRVVYVPPWNAWPPEGSWASISYTTVSTPLPVDTGDPSPTPAPTPVTSEQGLAVFANPSGVVAGSTFDAAEDGGGWAVSGNFAAAGSDDGVRHQAFAWGALSHYIYGVDEVQHLDFATGFDRARWYFEAPPAMFHRAELAGAYGGTLRFTVRSLYGNFSELNSPLDWVTLECAACNSGRGLRLVKFGGVDDFAPWDGRERQVELRLLVSELWQRDPLNSALNFSYATECDIAAVLLNVTRVAILGDFTRGGEGVAIDDVAVLQASAAEQPAFPARCQQGCLCTHSGEYSPLCC